VAIFRYLYIGMLRKYNFLGGMHPPSNWGLRPCCVESNQLATVESLPFAFVCLARPLSLYNKHGLWNKGAAPMLNFRGTSSSEFRLRGEATVCSPSAPPPLSSQFTCSFCYFKFQLCTFGNFMLITSLTEMVHVYL